MALFGRPTERDETRAAAYRQWLASRDPYAIASFVLGVFSLIEFGAVIVFGVVGAALGIVALRRLGAAKTQRFGHVLAIVGVITSVVSLCIAAHYVYRWI